MTRTARIEERVQIVIMLFMGGVAGAASFTHVHDLAVAYGQPSLIGWANAVVVELMSIVSGLEIRRRKRTGQSARFVYLVFFGAVLISLAAQVAKAHPSPWGWIMAALPALGFLAVVKIVLTRQPIETEPDRSGADDTGPVQISGRTVDLDTQTPADARTSPQRAGLDRTTATKDSDPVRTADHLDVGPVKSADRSADPDAPTDEVPAASSFLAGPVRSESPDGQDEADRWDVDQAAASPTVPVQRINGNHAHGSQAGSAGDERLASRSGRRDNRTGPDRTRTEANVSGPDRAWRDSDVSGPDRTGPGWTMSCWSWGGRSRRR